MATTSRIEWTEQTWNPTVGCTKISPGCKNCYAETMARRLKAIGVNGYENGFRLTLMPERLAEPLERRKPTVYFVNSMSDLHMPPFQAWPSSMPVVSGSPSKESKPTSRTWFSRERLLTMRCMQAMDVPWQTPNSR